MDNMRVSTDSVYAERRNELKKKLRERGLDALLVSRPANRFYLSGFELHDPQPDESSGRLLVTAHGRDWLATDSRYDLAARELWDAGSVFIYGANAAEDLARLMIHEGAVIGIESGYVPRSFWHGLERAGRGAGAPLLLAADGLVEELRLIKGPEEIAALRASFALNHKMLDWLEKKLAAGPLEISERELAWEIEKFFRENGARELAFACIVANGRAAALPHAVPRDIKINGAEPLLVDVGCRVDNYCSDQTRTYWPDGEPSQRFKTTLELVREAQRAALEIMRPGVNCADVYAAARNVFCKAGVEKAFTHGLGHGVGLQTHEAPSLSPRSKTILREGMVVTVEPGLYYADWGGARQEYTVLVEKDGVAIL